MPWEFGASKETIRNVRNIIKEHYEDKYLQMFDEATSVSYRVFLERKFVETGICNKFESLDQDTVFMGQEIV